MLKTLAIAALVQFANVAGHSCIHDAVQARVSVVSGLQRLADNGRRYDTVSVCETILSSQ
jgi:hypothetical protein